MQTLSPSPQAYVLDGQRLAALSESGLLTPDFEPAFDRWTRLAGDLIQAPIALLSLVDRDRQFFKSHVGLPRDIAVARETPLSHSFCKHVVARRERFVVNDAHEDPRVLGNPAVEEVGVTAYAGQPVIGLDGHVIGALCVIDMVPRRWTPAELTLLEDLTAGLIAEIELRAALRASEGLRDDLAGQALIDGLTGIPNRQSFFADLLQAVKGNGPQVLATFDLDGFKLYNDAFGHPAGDLLLERLAGRLTTTVAADGGRAYRVGGDEFCVLVHDADAVLAAADALQEHGDGFSISSGHGLVHLDERPLEAKQALQMADQRLHDSKSSRSDPGRQQAHDVLLGVLGELGNDLGQHVRRVAVLALKVGLQLGISRKAREDVVVAAHLHDIGKLAIPDCILDKTGPLDDEEWAAMREHTLLGERILAAAPGLRGGAALVRSSHERWDGGGYPDGLAAWSIPLGARIVTVCDAYDAMTSDRPYAVARAPESALAELRADAGTQFDPGVVEALAAVVT